MLSSIQRQHQKNKALIKDENEKLRKAAIDSSTVATGKILEGINSEVSQIFENQKKIDAESRKLQAETAKFSKQTYQWLALMENLNQSLKELGDVENWAKIIENDLLSIADTLEKIHHN